MNNTQRTGSPNINRTSSPASMAHSRAASRTNSIGASSLNPNATNNTNVQVKTEPNDRFLPGSSTSGTNAQAAYPGYNPTMPNIPHLQMPPNMNMQGIPNLNSFPGISNHMNAINAYSAGRGVPGYTGGAGPGPADARNILMLPRGAAPYNPSVTNGTNKMPQVDGSWDEEPKTRQAKRQELAKRYPWMAEAQIHNLVAREERMPQVDGPTPATPPVPPLNLLPPLNLNNVPSGSGMNRDGAPPPLTLPPLNLPMASGSSQGGGRALHPSLMNNSGSNSADVKRPSPPSSLNSSLSNSANAGPSSSFARNPNVPALASEDINSDLDDSEDEEGPQEQPGSDPDADVTYCTYDKVTRVKTKWKVVFRDGMVHANGKDYLFGRCTGEFDW
ncbi:hypothetical protein M408DRAFT_327720 [Serendipita vermifera MAFF 305830]|uniref:Uncharacterized protein n=1 Tax=Serendipita vermifera MAFF 305830 TaxID=933852 RepID=A0A0C3BJ68_SERVB|nr:hypothetical protein M408DRAFT_327720 [Serendipita vermifera MAFF 305830]